MAYILFAALIFAVGWGLKSAMAIPHPDGLTVILSSTIVLVGSLFWVVVTLHALDLLVAFKRDDRRYLSEFAAAMRPRLPELVLATPLMLLGLTIAYRVVGTAGTVVAALEAPFYALAIAAALMARPKPGADAPRWRTGVVLSLIYGALFAVTAALQSAVATRTGMQSAAPWLGVTSALAAVAALVSAAKFRSSIEQGRALSSPVLDSFGNPASGVRGSKSAPGSNADRKPRDPSQPPAYRQLPPHGRRKPGRRR